MDRTEAVRTIAATQGGLITRAQALLAGFSRHEVDNLVRYGRWSPLARSVYLIGPEPARRSRIRAAVQSLGPQAHAVFATAAELHGIGGLPARNEIHVALPGRTARSARVRETALVVHQLEHPPESIVVLDGIPVTDVVHTVAELILRTSRFSAVCVLDSALNRGLLAPADLAAIPHLIRGRRGAVAARRFLAEADGRAQSPLETRVRLRCIDGKVAPEVLQHDVRDQDGYLLGVADLAWLRARVLAEADGRVAHTSPDAVFADRRRQNLLVNAGWTVLRFTWADTLRPDYIPYTVRSAFGAGTGTSGRRS